MITHDNGEVEYLSEGEYEALVQASVTIEDEARWMKLCYAYMILVHH